MAAKSNMAQEVNKLYVCIFRYSERSESKEIDKTNNNVSKVNSDCSGIETGRMRTDITLK